MEMVFLHGPAAAGKLTTARALSATTGFAVFHNHLVVDALLALFPFGSAEFVRLRDLYWISAFEAAAEAGRSLIFTFAPEPTVPGDFVERARAAVESRGGKVHFVELTVSTAAQEARIENEDRRRYNKLSSLGTLRQLRSTHSRVSPAIPSAVTIDTSASPPEETASRIADALGLERVQPHQLYPS